MRKTRALAAAIVCLGAVALAAAENGPAWPSAKAFPNGCWRGKGAFGGTQSSPGVKVTISGGSVTFVLRVKSGKAAGHLSVTAHGTASIAVSGSSASGSMDIKGSVALTGKPAAVVGKGKYAFSGKVTANGVTVPLVFQHPVNGPLTIDVAGATKVTGRWDNARWTATKAPCG